MKKILIVSVLLGWTILAFAANTVSRQVKGVGKTRQLAINNALYEAVGQVQGVRVGSAAANVSVDVGSINVDSEETKKSLEVESISVDTLETINLTQAQGLVQSYEVISEIQDQQGLWHIELIAKVFDYASPLQSKNFSLAVLDFEAAQRVCPFGNIEIPATRLSEQLSQKLIDMLSASGKFNILDREYNSQFAREKNILQSDDTSLSEKSKLQNVISADYILTGKIELAQLLEELKFIPAINKPLSEYQADFLMQVTLLAAPTRQIVFTKEYRLKLDNRQTRDIIDLVGGDDDIDFEEVKNFLLEQMARTIVEDLLEQLYPVRIALAGEQIIIDQGGSRVNDGDIYQVFQTGEKIVSPDTNEILGYSESFVADIKIVKILPKFSYAQAINGGREKIAAGQICRLLRTHQEESVPQQQGKTTTVEQSPSGGVKLPFDK